MTQREKETDEAAEIIRESHRQELAGLTAKHAAEINLLDLKLQIMEHRWRQAEAQVNEMLLQINLRAQQQPPAVPATPKE